MWTKRNLQHKLIMKLLKLFRISDISDVEGLFREGNNTWKIRITLWDVHHGN